MQRNLWVLLAFAIGCKPVADECGGFSPDTASASTPRPIVTTGANRAPTSFELDQTAGDFVVLATYAYWSPGPVYVTPTDTFGETWVAGTPEAACSAITAQLYYTRLVRSGRNTITLTGSQGTGQAVIGAFAKVYPVAGNGPFSTNGDVGTGTADSIFDAGQLDASGDTILVALFESLGGHQLLPGSGYAVAAHEDGLAAILLDQQVDTGTYTPTARMHDALTSNCWVASSPRTAGGAVTIRAVAALACVAACGRIGFSPCGSGASDNSAITSRVLAAPGAVIAPAQVSLDQTAGDFIVLAIYTAWNPGAASPLVSDSVGESWQTTALESACNSTVVRLFYAFVTHDGPNVVTVHGNIGDGQATAGIFAAAYTNVATSYTIQSSNSDTNDHTAAASTTTLDTGDLVLDASGLIVTVFQANYAGMPLAADPSSTVVASDDTRGTALVETPAGPGTFAPTATITGGALTDCWVASAIALRAQ